jgi:beta-lactamase regulating signal transducer with metallopeptidase domain/Leucine-rich repeat (LRR) protein
MSRFGDEFIQLAWTQLWQVTLVIVVVAVVVQLAARRRPHLAYLLWSVVLLKCLTPPVVSSPTGLFSWLTREAPPARVTVVPPLELSNVATQPAPAVMLVAPDAIAPRTPAPPRETAWSWSETVAAIWLAGVVATAAVCAMRWLRWRSVVRRGGEPSPEVATLLHELSGAFHLRRRVTLRLTERPVGPFTIGWLRPVIVLPASLARGMSPEELRAVLAHELSHVRRWDALTAWLQIAAQALWWFHPLVWWANRQMNRAREGACDEETVATLRLSPKLYAASLVRALELRPAFPAFTGAVGMRAIDVTKSRLEHIMTRHQQFSRRTPASAWIAGMLVGCLLLPGAALGWQAEAPAPEETTVNRDDAAPSAQGPSAKHVAALKKIKSLGAVMESMPGRNGTRVVADLTQWTGTTDEIALLNDLDQLDSVQVATIYRFQGDDIPDPDPPATANVTDAWLEAVSQLPRVNDVGIGLKGNYSAEGLSQLRDLPDLRSLSLTGVTNEQFRGVSELPALRTVSIRSGDITDQGLASLAPLSNLETLWVICPDVTGAFLETIATCQNLRVLLILDQTKPPQGLASLRVFPKLVELTITEQVDNAAFEQFAKLPLTKLGVEGPFTDEALVHLQSMTQLEWLSLNSNEITGSGLKNLTGLTELRHLGISGTKIVDGDLDQLKTLNKVEEVTLYYTGVSEAKQARLKEIFPSLKEPEAGASFSFVPFTEPAGNEAIERVKALGGRIVQAPMNKNLNWVYLNQWTGTVDDLDLLKQVPNLELVETTIILSVLREGAKRPEGEPDYPHGKAIVTDAWLAKFAELPDLKALHISSQADYTAAGLEALAKAPKLESLWLDGVGDEAVPAIAKVTNLTDLRMSNGRFTDEGLAQLKPLTKLRSLACGSREMTGAGLKELAACTELEELQLPYTAFNDESMAHLPQFKKLKQLMLYNTKITDEGMKQLAGMTELTDLRLESDAITDAGVKQLAGLTKLRYLDLGRTEITGEALANLTGMTDLRVLNLHQTPIRDEDLVHLKDLKELNFIQLWGTEVTQKGVDQLHEWFPEAKDFNFGVDPAAAK